MQVREKESVSLAGVEFNEILEPMSADKEQTLRSVKKIKKRVRCKHALLKKKYLKKKECAASTRCSHTHTHTHTCSIGCIGLGVLCICMYV